MVFRIIYDLELLSINVLGKGRENLHHALLYQDGCTYKPQ